MPLPLPVLDDRRWADLVEEGRSLIPLYAPEWTDHNVHDPGITLVELLAWIAEMDLYQINRIPERHRLKFLALLGLRPRPPEPSRTVVGFRLRHGDAPVPLPATLELEGTNAFGEMIRFRTLEAVRAVAGELRAIQSEDAGGFHDLTVPWRRGEPVALLGPDPRPGTAVYLGFSASLGKDERVSLAVAVTDWHSAAEVRKRLREEARALREACAPPARPCVCGQRPTPPTEARPADVAFPSTPAHHSARTVWEFLASTGEWRTLDPTSGDPGKRQVEDETRSLTLDGRVTLLIPDDMTRRRLGAVGEELFYVRCRLAAGAYDAPPTVRAVALNGVAAEQAIAAGSLTWSIAPGAPVEGEAPRRGARARLDARFDKDGWITRLVFTPEGPVAFGVRELQLPTDTVPGRLTVEAAALGDGTGRPDQHAFTSSAPVVESSLEVFTREEGRLREWRLRPDFDASRARDADAVLEPVEGVVSFGDGERGRVPPAGAPILAAFDTTRAEAGNLDRDNPVSRLSDSPHNRALLEDFEGVKERLALENPVPAKGGSAAETVAEAAGRALELMERPTRAVTAKDHEFLARETPGVRLARVWARANLHPAFPCFEAPGVTTVIVMPYLPADRPTPSPGLLRAVASYLQRRRVLGTRVEVVGPTYLGVTVRATVRAHPGVDPEALAGRVTAALKDFFDPRTGGPDDGGWPFGRDVYRTEVLQVVDRTDGVDHVLSLELVAEGRPQHCGNVCLSPTDLVASGPHQIEVVSDELC